MSMSLDGVQNVVLLFSDPVYDGQNTVPSTILRNLTAVSGNIAYSDHVTDNLTVLVSKYAGTENGVLQGLLYVPDLARDDPCKIAERAYVSDSAVRQGNLPSTNYNLIALAPWFNANCTQSYLASARYDPLRAFIFYRPTNDTAKPPGPNAAVWDLFDDGAWKTDNHFPIFAVSGTLGAEMMYQLSLYSGNLREVPFGENISEIYNPDPDDYVRIWTELTVSTPTGLPNVWVFILVVVGVLLAVITLTSLFLHLLWRRRRISLQRRVIQGEINLEAMGIKRLAVPFSHIQSFPLFTYNYDATPPQTPPRSSISRDISSVPPSDVMSGTSARLARPFPDLTTQRNSEDSLPQGQQASDAVLDNTSETFATAAGTRSQAVSQHQHRKSTSPVPEPPQALLTTETASERPATGDLNYQPVCQICLEPYQIRSTVIRELSCGHIFHPDCIDEFLGFVSSLCPLCKACMLPKGYSPRITNAMVRRERAIRRLRERVVVEEIEGCADRRGWFLRGWGSYFKGRLHSATDRLTMSSNIGTATDASTDLKSQPFVDSQSLAQLPSMSTSEATRRRMARLAGVKPDDLQPDNKTWKDRIKNVWAKVL